METEIAEGNRGDTVRQTIVETIEAPRLRDVSTSDFVEFQERREIYERQVSEKNTEAGVQIPLTTYRNSIDSAILELFVVAEWVPVTEEQLRKCVREHARVDPKEYDLARIERELAGIKLEKADNMSNLQRQVWRLCLRYSEKLRKCGNVNFAKQQPKIAVRHIMKRVTHAGLRTRMNLTLGLRKEELEKVFSKFMRLLAEESIDRQDSAWQYQAEQYGSEDELEERTSKNRHRGRKGGSRSKNHNTDAVTGRAESKGKNSTGGEKRKRQRELPLCLLPRCGKHHFIKDCTSATEDEKSKYLQEYRDKRRKVDKPGGNIGGIADSCVDSDNTSLFTANFCNGAVEYTVMADQGFDINVLPPGLLKLISKADPHLKIEQLKEIKKFHNARKSAPPLYCGREAQIDVELRIRHCLKRMMRGKGGWSVTTN